MNPIELSDDAWKIVETERRSASIAANVRAAMPCTPIMPLPATVTIAWPVHDRQRLDRIRGRTSGAPTLRCRALSGSRNERTWSTIRVPAIGISARGCSTLAP